MQRPLTTQIQYLMDMVKTCQLQATQNHYEYIEVYLNRRVFDSDNDVYIRVEI